MSRTSREYDNHPNLPGTHFIDNRIHADADIWREEQRKILERKWKFVCHESELPNRFDYRTTTVAQKPIIVIRGGDGVVRSFYNACPHRGSVLARDPRGNARNITCLFHLWSFDPEGNCTTMTRPEGYAGCNLGTEDVGLREVRTETRLGLVFANLDDAAPSLDDYLGDALENAQEVLEGEEFEVFHYHSSVVRANWKLWHETNVDLYHEWMHSVNRRTGIHAEGYFDRRFLDYGNGHLGMEPYRVKYENYPGWEARDANTLPGLTAGEFRFIDLFPNTTIVLRATVIRIDTSTPISPTHTRVEWRGLAPKSDTPEIRRQRVNHHNQVWGPFGRNLPEDVIAVEGVQRSIDGAASPYSLHAREEGGKGQDDGGSRTYYAEWSRCMGRSANDPYGADRVDADAAE